MKERMFSWMSPKLEIRSSSIHGKGVFAKKDIKKDEILFVISGYVITVEDDNKTNDKFVIDYEIDLSEDFSIGPLKPSDMELMPQHYINHSCNPNAGINGQVFIVAMRNISRGEEIVYDYAMVTSRNERSNLHFKMKCFCGSKNCRKIIKEDDWKIPELQERYDGYFQWAIQEKINKLKSKNKNKN